METLDEVTALLGETLELGQRARNFTSSTPLFGSLPELDSMAVVQVIAALEERFGIAVDDEEINADTFATVGSVTDFVDQKIRR